MTSCPRRDVVGWTTSIATSLDRLATDQRPHLPMLETWLAAGRGLHVLARSGPTRGTRSGVPAGTAGSGRIDRRRFAPARRTGWDVSTGRSIDLAGPVSESERAAASAPSESRSRRASPSGSSCTKGNRAMTRGERGLPQVATPGPACRADAAAGEAESSRRQGGRAAIGGEPLPPAPPQRASRCREDSGPSPTARRIGNIPAAISTGERVRHRAATTRHAGVAGGLTTWPAYAAPAVDLAIRPASVVGRTASDRRRSARGQGAQPRPLRQRRQIAQAIAQAAVLAMSARPRARRAGRVARARDLAVASRRGRDSSIAAGGRRRRGLPTASDGRRVPTRHTSTPPADATARERPADTEPRRGGDARAPRPRQRRRRIDLATATEDRLRRIGARPSPVRGRGRVDRPDVRGRQPGATATESQRCGASGHRRAWPPASNGESEDDVGFTGRYRVRSRVVVSGPEGSGVLTLSPPTGPVTQACERGGLPCQGRPAASARSSYWPWWPCSSRLWPAP